MQKTSFIVTTFFVTGGTGLVGFSIIKKLREADFNVIALVRHSSQQKIIDELIENEVKIVYGDLLDPSSYEYYLSTVDVVIHTAALVRSKNTKEYFNINFDGTRILLKVMRSYSIFRLIYMSTVGVYGATYKKNISEKEKPCPVSPYEKSKFRSERLIIEEFKDIKASIIRSPFIFGDASKDRHVLPSLGKFTKKNLLIKAWRYNPKLGFTHSYDLASSIMLLSCSNVTTTEIYNVQSMQISSQEIISILRTAAQRRIFVLPVPYTILSLVTSLVDFINKRKGKATYLRKNLKKFKYDWTFSSTKLKSEYDWVPIHTDSKELEILLDQYLKIIYP